jgi:hypothetical protein
LEAALRKQLLASAAAFAEEIAEHAPAAASLAAGLRRQQRGDQTPCPFCARTFPADALAAHVREGHFESARAAYVATESAERAAIAAARAASAKNLLERAVAERAAITKAKKRRAEETTAETKARAAIEVEEALAFRNLLRRNRRGPKRAREETTENQTVDTTTDHTRPPQPEEQPVIDAPGPDDSPPPPEEQPLDDETAEEQAPDDNPPKPAEQPPNNGTAAQHAPPGNPPPAEQQPEHATTAPAPKGTKKKQAKKAEEKPQPKQPRKLTAPRLDHKAVEAAKGFAKHKSQAGAAEPFTHMPAATANLVPTGFGEAFGTENGENRCAVNVAVAAANSVMTLVPPSLPNAAAARDWARLSVDPFLKFTPPTAAKDFPCALQMLASVFAAADVELECVPVSGPVSPNPSAAFVLQEWPPGAPLNLDPALRANAVIYSRPGSHFVCAVWSARFSGFFLLDDAVCQFVGPTAPEPPAPCWTVAGVLFTRNPGGGASERPRRLAALNCMSFLSALAARSPQADERDTEEASAEDTEGDSEEAPPPPPQEQRQEAEKAADEEAPEKPNCSCGRAPGRQGRHRASCPVSAASRAARGPRRQRLPNYWRGNADEGPPEQTQQSNGEGDPSSETAADGEVDLLAVLRKNVVLLERVPRDAAAPLAQCLRKALADAAADAESELLWSRVLLFPSLCLCPAARHQDRSMAPVPGRPLAAQALRRALRHPPAEQSANRRRKRRAAF